MHKRFTIDGSPALEQHLQKICGLVLAGIREVIPTRKLEGLVLGGGYGRGEGGVLRGPSGDQPYNDLEYYLFLRGNELLNRRRYGQALNGLAHRLSSQAGVEVEFKLTSLAKLRQSPPSMFYYDLVMGHRLLFGGEELLAGCEAHQDARQIPLAEATRLLMNRGAGLLFAKTKLQNASLTPEDADFIGRNQAKAQLAFGDAVLAVVGQYHWSCSTRHQRLLQLTGDWPWLKIVQQHHEAGVAFKLHPQISPPERKALELRQEELTQLTSQLWLWVEKRRLNTTFSSAREYALWPGNKCPEKSWWRNTAINLTTFGPSAELTRITRYPRERLLNALALLLWEPDAFRGPSPFESCSEATPDRG